MTLRINSKIEYLSTMLRAGVEGGLTDNNIAADGREMLCIGVGDNGVVQDYGVYCSGEKVKKLPTGFVFEGTQIPNFKKAVELVCKAHENLEMFDSVGWDVVIQEDGTPIIMEYNLKAPVF